MVAKSVTFDLKTWKLSHQEDKRQAAWRRQSVERLIAARERRLKEVNQAEDGVLRAIRAYENLPPGDTMVQLRRAFVGREESATSSSGVGPSDGDKRSVAARRRDQAASRPPMGRLMSKRGHALNSYLAVLWVTQREKGAGKRFKNKHGLVYDEAGASWSTLTGRYSESYVTRRDRMRRDLERLSDGGLAFIPSGPGGREFKGFDLLSDNGSGRVYRVPAANTPLGRFISLPEEFFTRGWHLVLSQAEIGMLLVTYDMWARVGRLLEEGDRQSIKVPTSVRRGRYGLSDEAYHAIHNLEEYGLIEVRDPMKNRRNGKLTNLGRGKGGRVEDERKAATPYALTPLADSVFDRFALDVVRGALTDNRVPARLDDDSILFERPTAGVAMRR
jgi:hypothetical protein